MPSLKIALVVSQSSGGIGTHVAGLAAALRRRGHHVLVLSDEATAERFHFGPHLAAERLPHVLPPTWKAALAGADVIHAHGHRAGLIARIWLTQLPRATRPTFALSWHNDFSTAGAAGTARKAAARLSIASAQIVAGASSDLCTLARSLGAQETFLEEVPSPLVPELLATERPDNEARMNARRALFSDICEASSRPGLPDQDYPQPGDLERLSHLPLILTTARWAPQKRLNILGEIAANLSPEAVWVVLGDGERALAQEAADIARGSNTHLYFLGRSSQVRAWLSASDVFVLPSRWEARALVLQEAMATGVPAVATNAGGIPDLLGGRAGFLRDDKDVLGFASAITQALGAEGEVRAERARAKVASFPSIDELAEHWVELYRQAGTAHA